MTDTAFFLVKEPLTEGYRVRMTVRAGLVNVKASVGRVPQKNKFQLIGVPDDDLGRQVTLTISDTVPCPECGMADFNLYLLVENNGNEPAEFDIWLEESYEPLIPGLPYAGSVVLVLFFVCLFVSCLALLGYIALIKLKRHRANRPVESLRAQHEKEKARQRSELKRGARGGDTVTSFDTNEVQLENITKYDEAALAAPSSPGRHAASHHTINADNSAYAGAGGFQAYDESSFGGGGGGGGGGTMAGGSIDARLYSGASGSLGAFVCGVCGNAYVTQVDLQLHCQKRGHAYPSGGGTGDVNFRDAMSQPFDSNEYGFPDNAPGQYDYHDDGQGGGDDIKSLF